MTPIAVRATVYRAPVEGLTGPLWPSQDPDRSLLPSAERTVRKYRLPARIVGQPHSGRVADSGRHGGGRGGL
ncbi:MAG: hypothetical protein ACRDQ7_27710 [Haloechinothrix sp.]